MAPQGPQSSGLRPEGLVSFEAWAPHDIYIYIYIYIKEAMV